MNLGENIYRLRTQKNLSQGELADALEVSRQSVSKWENNSAVPELEKLVKMAHIFGVTIDELVTGEEKEEPADSPTPPPQSTPQQPVPAKQGLSPQQILGIVLLTFGALCLIVFTVVGIFIGLWLLGLFISLPFILCGTVCLVCKKNVGLKCAWSVYLPIWLLCSIVIVSPNGAMLYLVSGSLLLAGTVLTFITIRRMITGQISLPGWAKVLSSVGMILLLLITLFSILPPMEVAVTNPFESQETLIVTPADPSKEPTATP